MVLVDPPCMARIAQYETDSDVEKFRTFRFPDADTFGRSAFEVADEVQLPYLKKRLMGTTATE